MWKEWSIIEARLSKVYPFALERRAIRAHVALSGHVRAVSVAHLSLLERENQGVTHPSFDRTAKRFILAHRMPVWVADLPDENSPVTTTWSVSTKA
jgi:hypothetical protein